MGVGGAALVAQLLGLAAAPVVSRLVTPVAFGQFGLFFGLANVLVTLALLGFTDAILAAHSEDDAEGLLSAGLQCVMIASPLLSFVAFGLIYLGAFGYGKLPYWTALLMLPEVAAISCVMLLQMWRIRRQEFRSLAYGHLTLGVARPAGQVGGGLLNLGFFGLAVADLLSRVAVMLVIGRGLWTDVRRVLRRSRDDVLDVAWRYRLFPLFRTSSMFANNLGTAMPPSLVAMAYGVSAAGLYTLMWSVIVAPSALVQKAVGDVFLGHFADRFRSDPHNARRFLLVFALGLLLLSVGPGLVLWLWGAPVFAVLFGESWRAAGRLASLMVPLLMADFSIGPLGGALNVVNRPDAKLLFDAARLGGYGAAYYFATRSGRPLEGMITMFAQFGVMSYAVYAALIFFGTRHPRSVLELTVDLPARSG